MNAEEVMRLYDLFQDKGIEIWIDGGWGIDALIGHQTRPHDDLDIAADRKNLKELNDLLASIGYTNSVRRNDTSEWNYVLADNKDNKIDIHIFEFDSQGKNVYGVSYPRESLTGTGIINGQEVRCIALEWVVRFHEAYEPDENDIKDIKALREKFRMELPKNYKNKL